MKRKLYICYVINFTFLIVSLLLLKLADKVDSNTLLIFSLLMIVATGVITTISVIKTYRFVKSKKVE